LHCNGAKTYNSHSHEHCSDQAFVDLGLELFHKFARLQAMLVSVNYKNQKTSILASQAILVKLAACLKYLCGFLLSLKAQAMPLSIFKSKYRQGSLKTASPPGPDFPTRLSPISQRRPSTKLASGWNPLPRRCTGDTERARSAGEELSEDKLENKGPVTVGNIVPFISPYSLTLTVLH
jgi:hypothetical protein